MLKIVCEIKFRQCHTLFIICSVNFTESKSLNLIILYFSCDWLNLKKKNVGIFCPHSAFGWLRLSWWPQ